MTRRFAFLVFPAALFLSAGSAAAACVENATNESLYFTIESRPAGARIGASLSPGEELCLLDTPFAVFTVFATGTSVEGCPRLAGPDGRDRLLHFLPTDSCRWASHED